MENFKRNKRIHNEHWHLREGCILGIFAFKEMKKKNTSQMKIHLESPGLTWIFFGDSF